MKSFLYAMLVLLVCCALAPLASADEHGMDKDKNHRHIPWFHRRDHDRARDEQRDHHHGDKDRDRDRDKDHDRGHHYAYGHDKEQDRDRHGDRDGQEPRPANWKQRHESHVAPPQIAHNTVQPKRPVVNPVAHKQAPAKLGGGNAHKTNVKSVRPGKAEEKPDHDDKR